MLPLFYPWYGRSVAIRYSVTSSIPSWCIIIPVVIFRRFEKSLLFSGHFKAFLWRHTHVPLTWHLDQFKGCKLRCTHTLLVPRLPMGLVGRPVNPSLRLTPRRLYAYRRKKQIHNWHETSLVFTGCYTLHTQLQVRCGQLSSKFLHKYAIQDIVSRGR